MAGLCWLGWTALHGVLGALAALPRTAVDSGMGVILALRRPGHRHPFHHGMSTKKTLLALVDHVGEEG